MGRDGLGRRCIQDAFHVHTTRAIATVGWSFSGSIYIQLQFHCFPQQYDHGKAHTILKVWVSVGPFSTWPAIKLLLLTKETILSVDSLGERL